jgi:hypothetical protein
MDEFAQATSVLLDLSLQNCMHIAGMHAKSMHLYNYISYVSYSMYVSHSFFPVIYKMRIKKKKHASLPEPIQLQ